MRAPRQISIRDYQSLCQVLDADKYGRYHGRYGGSGLEVQNFAAYRVIDVVAGKIAGMLCDRNGNSATFTVTPNFARGLPRIEVFKATSVGDGIQEIPAIRRINAILAKGIDSVLTADEDRRRGKRHNYNGIYLENHQKNMPLTDAHRRCYDYAVKQRFMTEDFAAHCIDLRIKPLHYKSGKLINYSLD